jgi:2-iminobutanoate/2-iminopropanoate deaminase
VTKKPISSPNAPKAIGPYAQAIAVGNLLFTSGQIPLDPQSGEVVGSDVETQTEQVLKNLMAVLAAADATAENVVKTTVFLADMADFAKMNGVYEKFLGKNPPARSTIQAAGLPRGVRVEIELVAAI